MTLQEIIKSLDELSAEEQASLMSVLNQRMSQTAKKKLEQSPEHDGETFWEMTLRFRERIEREGIEFTDEDFSNLRDRSPGREVEL